MSRFELFEEVRILNFHGVKFVFLIIKVFDTEVYGGNDYFVLKGLIKFHEVMIKLVLDLCCWIIITDVRNEFLEGSHHVAEETHVEDDHRQELTGEV